MRLETSSRAQRLHAALALVGTCEQVAVSHFMSFTVMSPDEVAGMTLDYVMFLRAPTLEESRKLLSQLRKAGK